MFFGFNVGMAPAGAIADEEWEDEPEEKPAEEDLDPDKNVEASKDSKNDTKVKEPEDGQATASDSAVPAAEGSE